jgi:hypothetical protein
VTWLVSRNTQIAEGKGEILIERKARHTPARQDVVLREYGRHRGMSVRFARDPLSREECVNTEGAGEMGIETEGTGHASYPGTLSRHRARHLRQEHLLCHSHTFTCLLECE